MKFETVFFITDSKIVQAMVHKESYGFNTYVAVRIGEIQESTDPQTWYWVDGKLNISDWLTRGKAPCELDLHSTWQKGPEFLRTHEDLWPIKNERWNDVLPEQVKVVMSCELARETLAERIDINIYSSYRRLIRVTARILSMCQRPNPSLMNIMNVLEFQDLCMAEIFWFKDAQLLLKDKFHNWKLKRLCPKLRSDGIIVAGTRDVEWHTYDELQLILLPYDHCISRLYAECIHREEGHLGVMSTTSKIRSRVWITNLPKLVRSIKNKCLICKKKNKIFEYQCMGPLPDEKLNPAPAWHTISIDFFGPMKIRGEVKKRSRGKAYGVLFNCLVSRAVYVDLSTNYTTEGLLMVLRRFVPLRGYPSRIFSDPGSQLVSASKELRDIIKGLDEEKLAKFGTDKGTKWTFSPPDSPWQNDCAESLVKSVKGALK